MPTNTAKIKLTYFDIEGVAEQCRLAFLLAGIPFQDERIKFQEWKDLKPKTPYGKLPLLQIGDDSQPKTQSQAILRYAASLDSTNNLYPLDKAFEVEECMGLIQDLQTYPTCTSVWLRKPTVIPKAFPRPNKASNW